MKKLISIVAAVGCLLLSTAQAQELVISGGAGKDKGRT